MKTALRATVRGNASAPAGRPGGTHGDRKPHGGAWLGGAVRALPALLLSALLLAGCSGTDPGSGAPSPSASVTATGGPGPGANANASALPPAPVDGGSQVSLLSRDVNQLRDLPREAPPAQPPSPRHAPCSASPGAAFRAASSRASSAAVW